MFNSNGKLFCCPVRGDDRVIVEKFEPNQVVDEEAFKKISDYIDSTKDISKLDETARYYKITKIYYEYRLKNMCEVVIFEEHEYEDFILEKYKTKVSINVNFLGLVPIGGYGKFYHINCKNFFKYFRVNLVNARAIEQMVNLMDFNNFFNTFTKNISYSPCYVWFDNLMTVVENTEDIKHRNKIYFHFVETLNSKIEYFLEKISEFNYWDEDTEKYNVLYFIFKNYMNLVARNFNWQGMEFRDIVSTVLKFMEYSRINLIFNGNFYLLENLDKFLTCEQYDIIKKIVGKYYKVEKVCEPSNYDFFKYNKFKIAEEYDSNIKLMKSVYNKKLIAIEKEKIIERRKLEFKRKIEELCQEEEQQTFEEIKNLEDFSNS